MHGRDHAPDGPDPIPGLDTGDGDGDGTPFTVTYASGTSSSNWVPAEFGQYLDDFTDIHSSGISFSAGGEIAISTPGIYEVLAAGLAEIDGPVSGDSYVSARVVVNGSWVEGYGLVGARLPIDIASGHIWATPMTLLDQRELDAGDVVKIQAANQSAGGAAFGRWVVVVTLLEPTT